MSLRVLLLSLVAKACLEIKSLQRQIRFILQLPLFRLFPLIHKLHKNTSMLEGTVHKRHRTAYRIHPILSMGSTIIDCSLTIIIIKFCQLKWLFFGNRCRPSDGKKVCLPWWFGTECRTHCIPHGDDNNGHYACAHDGSKTCKNGWHGENCTVFCVPQDDDVRGHYTCDIHGNKVCLDGYRPPECTDCLLGRYGANCSMTCSNSTQEGYYDCSDVGLMKCKQWWYGPLCQQYCVPHDDNMHGHYECNPRDGSKVCLAGWKGPSCLVTSKNWVFARYVIIVTFRSKRCT